MREAIEQAAGEQPGQPDDQELGQTEEPAAGKRPSASAVLCGAGLGLGVIATYVLIALTPSLLAHHSVLLEALNGSTTAIVTGGALARTGHTSLLLVALAPWSRL